MFSRSVVTKDDGRCGIASVGIAALGCEAADSTESKCDLAFACGVVAFGVATIETALCKSGESVIGSLERSEVSPCDFDRAGE